jgi:precorrin-8X/cobalt-precorrin-8 methylmutase
MSRSSTPARTAGPRAARADSVPTSSIPSRDGDGADPGYLRDPAAIYRESFATIRREATLDRFPADVAAIVARLIHACGMVDIAEEIAFAPEVGRAARDALDRGRPLICDSRMVAAGILRRRLPAANDVICTLGRPRVAALARRLSTTRAAAAVELWRERLDGAVVVIGNAPTALFHLIGGLRGGWPKPAAILAFPVGFIGAAESKEALLATPLGVPYITLRGRRGGSAMAAAAVNAILLGDSGEAP